MRFRLGLLSALLVIGAGCAQSKAPADDRVVNVAQDDARMNAAMDKARSTVNTFIAALKSPRSTQTAFSVKMRFNEGKKVEYMWLVPVTYDGKSFHGQVNNTPEKVTNVKLGQEVSLAPSEIADWMYVDNGTLVGGYTTRAVRDSMPPAERADFDKSLPFKVD